LEEKNKKKVFKRGSEPIAQNKLGRVLSFLFIRFFIQKSKKKIISFNKNFLFISTSCVPVSFPGCKTPLSFCSVSMKMSLSIFLNLLLLHSRYWTKIESWHFNGRAKIRLMLFQFSLLTKKLRKQFSIFKTHSSHRSSQRKQLIEQPITSLLIFVHKNESSRAEPNWAINCNKWRKGASRDKLEKCSTLISSQLFLLCST
jgi:hypothetical protein